MGAFGIACVNGEVDGDETKAVDTLGGKEVAVATVTMSGDDGRARWCCGERAEGG